MKDPDKNRLSANDQKNVIDAEPGTALFVVAVVLLLPLLFAGFFLH